MLTAAFHATFHSIYLPGHVRGRTAHSWRMVRLSKNAAEYWLRTTWRLEIRFRLMTILPLPSWM